MRGCEAGRRRPLWKLSQGTMMPRRIALLSALLLLLPAAICGAAEAAQTYTDPIGDVKGGAGPDVAAVTVSNTASTLTFRVRFASTPPLRLSAREKWVDMLLIGIDVPPPGPPPSIPGGEWLGANFALGAHGPSTTGLLVRLGKKHSAPPVRFKVVARGRTLSLSVPCRALGGPGWFTFNVAAAREGENQASDGGFDVAPEHRTFLYRLS
jgi:hypothetical protein